MVVEKDHTRTLARNVPVIFKEQQEVRLAKVRYGWGH